MVIFYKKWKKIQFNSINKKQNGLKQPTNEKSSTRKPVSEDIKKSFECVTITDSKFSNKSSGKNDAKEHIHKLGNNITWTVSLEVQDY